MNRKSKRRYPKVVAHWDTRNGESELTMENATVAEVRERAIKFGYKPPKWYFPWQYFTGGIFFVTVGFGV